MTAKPAFSPARRAKRILLTSVALGLCLSLAACKTSEEKADEYYQSGLNLLAEGDPERAIVQFRNVFELEGTHYEARQKLAEVLASQGNLEQSYSQYLRLAEQYPDDLETRVRLARMAFTARDLQEYERHTNRAVELAPNDPGVQALQLGLRYQTASINDNVTTRKDVLTQTEELVKTLPDDPVLLEILLDQAARDKNQEKIATLIEKLIKIQPENPLRYQQRLAFLVETGTPDQIEQHLLATIDHFPENDVAKADLIRFYVSQNKTDKAEDYLRKRAENAPADDPNPQADLIYFMRAQGDPEGARAELDRIIAAGGDPLVFGAMKAEFDFEDGEHEEAIAEANKILASVAEPTDKSRSLKSRLAHMLLRNGDVAGAKTQVDEILAQDKTHADALKLRAGWAIEADDTETAIQSLRSVLDRNPTDVLALGLMADAYGRAGESDLVRDYLAQAATASNNAPTQTIRLAQLLISEERYRPAEDAIIPALRKSPDNVQLLGLLGRVYLAMPDLPRAGDVIARLRGVDNEAAAGIADQLELARVSTQDGQEAALAHLEQLAQADNAGLQEKLRLIQARLSAGEFGPAKELATELAKDNPDVPAAQLALAMATAAGGDLDAARDIMQKIIASDPKQSAPYLALAVLERTQNGNEAAQEVIEQGLKEQPDNVDLLFTKAGLIERRGDVDEAIAIYEKLYAQNSNLVVVANNLASLLGTWHSDDPEKMTQASAISRRLKDSPIPAFMDTYGWIQHLNGDSETALPYLEKAAAGLKDDIAVQVHLGLVQEALGQTEPAKATLEQALKMEAAVGNPEVVADANAALSRIENAGQSGANAATGNQNNEETTQN